MDPNAANPGEVQQIARAFEALRQFAGKRRYRVELCELCRMELPEEHPHLVELYKKRMLCTCDACAMLFSGHAGSKYRRVPRQVRRIPGFRMTDAEWDGLRIPINLAFFLKNSSEQRVTAMYPSPAGATESLLSLEAWNGIVQANPVLHELEPDVEALLVNRVTQQHENLGHYYMVPVDTCYRLVGLIRIHWRGLSGGTEVWQEIAKFFGELESRAQVVQESTHA